ncbi:MAG: hypothetical protein P4M02_00890, partial [Clostridia bacterium]|nr:hypothetical protein [Clostridia bacterium]
MNNEELLAYRQQIIEDAIRMKKKPDRTPHFANYWTWKILDSGYKLSEALYDWDKLEDSTIKFQKKYGFDMLVDDGVRDPMQVIEPIGQSSYEVDDEKEIMNIRDVSFMSPDDYDLFLKDYPRFLWEVVLPNKANRFNSDLTLEQFGEVFNRFNGYAKCTQNIVTRLNTECGTPAGMLSTQSTIPGYEQLFNFYRGIKGTASDMRRIPDKFKAACDLLDEMQLYPALEQLKTSTRRANASVDFIGLMLGHTILSIKQWEAFYWPSFKRMLDAVVA